MRKTCAFGTDPLIFVVSFTTRGNKMQNLTLYSLANIVSTFDHLNDEHVAVIKYAVKCGYVLQLSATQVQFTESGLEKATAELPDFKPGDEVTTWSGEKGVILEINLDSKSKPLTVSINFEVKPTPRKLQFPRKQFYHFDQCVKTDGDIIFLNGEKYRLGMDTCLSIGQDAQCFDVVTKSVICRGENGFYLKNGGIRISLEGFTLEEFFVDNRANRKELREKCKATRKTWEDGVAKQLANL